MPKTTQPEEPTPSTAKPKNKTIAIATSITVGTALLGFMAYATIAYTVEAFNPETIKNTTVTVEKTLKPEPVTVVNIEQAKACNSYIKETQLDIATSSDEIIAKLDTAASKTSDTQLANQIKEAAKIYAAMYSETEPDQTFDYNTMMQPLQTCFNLGVYPTE